MCGKDNQETAIKDVLRFIQQSDKLVLLIKVLHVLTLEFLLLARLQAFTLFGFARYYKKTAQIYFMLYVISCTRILRKTTPLC